MVPQTQGEGKEDGNDECRMANDERMPNVRRTNPAFVVLPDPGGGLKGGPPAWGSGFLPATYQGTTMRSGKTPVLNLKPQPGISDQQQRSTLDFLRRMNERHLIQRENDDELSARIEK